MNKTNPEKNTHKHVSFNKEMFQNPKCDKIETIIIIFSNNKLKARISFLSKRALKTPTMECLTLFVLDTKSKKMRNHMAKAISLVENISNKQFIKEFIDRI